MGYRFLCWENAGSPPQVRGKLTAAAATTAAAMDHPRRCGENYTPHLSACAQPGSPPQVRGKLPRHEGKVVSAGITPAGAGKTIVWIPYLCPSWDHPRRCGENGAKSRHSTKRLGSPPQVRGKPACSAASICRMRITPAGAGKTQPKPA